jgi:hypothetical protein
MPRFPFFISPKGVDFLLEHGRIPVFFQISAYGFWAYRFQLFSGFPGVVKGQPLGDSARLLPHKRDKDLAETSFPARLYRKNARIRRGTVMTSWVYARFPARFAGRFFSGLSFTVSPSTVTKTSLTGPALKRRIADFRW